MDDACDSITIEIPVMRRIRMIDVDIFFAHLEHDIARLSHEKDIISPEDRKELVAFVRNMCEREVLFQEKLWAEAKHQSCSAFRDGGGMEW